MFLDYHLNIEKQSVWKIAYPNAEARSYPFVVNESGFFCASKRFYTQRYAKNDYQILYTTSGAAELDYCGSSWRIGEGSLVVIDCNKHHDYRTAHDAEHWTYYWIHAGGDYCEKYYNAIYANGFQPYVLGVDSELVSFFEEALQQIDYTTDTAYIRLSNTVSDVFTKLITFLNAIPLSPQEIMIAEAVSYMKSNYSEQFNIDELTKRLSISKYYFIKLFTKQVGMTPYHYLILYRVNEAKKLLRATDHKINDIAQAVGFADVSNFSRTFTKMTGITPGKYRES